MSKVPRDLLDELRVLANGAQEDFQKRFWANYPRYLHQFNSLVTRIQQAGFCQDVVPLEPVPGTHRSGTLDRFSAPEQAKLREIANAAQVLVNKVSPDSDGVGRDAVAIIERLCTRFHLVARQVRQRHAGRNTLDVEDEYDVQDLFHALLMVDFDDIRAEEWTPSYAGKSARMDFLLKNESVVIEIKKTRKGLTAKEVGDELLIDIQRYQAHQDCGTLICFVYDPDGRIANPRGVEIDLNSRSRDGLGVIVLIRPTGA